MCVCVCVFVCVCARARARAFFVCFVCSHHAADLLGIPAVEFLSKEILAG